MILEWHFIYKVSFYKSNQKQNVSEYNIYYMIMITMREGTATTQHSRSYEKVIQKQIHSCDTCAVHILEYNKR